MIGSSPIGTLAIAQALFGGMDIDVGTSDAMVFAGTGFRVADVGIGTSVAMVFAGTGFQVFDVGIGTSDEMVFTGTGFQVFDVGTSDAMVFAGIEVCVWVVDVGTSDEMVFVATKGGVVDVGISSVFSAALLPSESFKRGAYVEDSFGVRGDVGLLKSVGFAVQDGLVFAVTKGGVVDVGVLEELSVRAAYFVDVLGFSVVEGLGFSTTEGVVGEYYLGVDSQLDVRASNIWDISGCGVIEELGFSTTGGVVCEYYLGVDSQISLFVDYTDIYHFIVSDGVGVNCSAGLIRDVPVDILEMLDVGSTQVSPLVIYEISNATAGGVYLSGGVDIGLQVYAIGENGYILSSAVMDLLISKGCGCSEDFALSGGSNLVVIGDLDVAERMRFSSVISDVTMDYHVGDNIYTSCVDSFSIGAVIVNEVEVELSISSVFIYNSSPLSTIEGYFGAYDWVSTGLNARIMSEIVVYSEDGYRLSGGENCITDYSALSISGIISSDELASSLVFNTIAVDRLEFGSLDAVSKDVLCTVSDNLFMLPTMLNTSDVKCLGVSGVRLYDSKC